MMLDEALFGPTPESFQPVDIYFPVGKPFFMVDREVAIPAEHERIVRLVPVGVNDAAAPYGLNGKAEKRFSAHVPDRFHPDDALALQDTEYGNFTGCAASAFAFSFAAEVTFVQFDLAAQQFGRIGGGTENRMAYNHHCPVNGIIGHGELRGNLVR